jgi:hypothetical protein
MSPNAKERSKTPDLIVLLELRVVLVKLHHRIDMGNIGGKTPALLSEAKRLADVLSNAIAGAQTGLAADAVVRVGAALDTLDALRNRIES